MVGNTVAAINGDAQRVADLNGAIQHAVASGTDAHDLMDQRDVIIDRLSSTAGVTVRALADGTVTLSLGGSPLVAGDRAERSRIGGRSSARSPRRSTPYRCRTCH